MTAVGTALLMLLGAAPDVHRYALVLGSNSGEDISAAALRFADDDAVAMHELLTEAGVESVLLTRLDDDSRRLHPKTVPDAPPTLDAVRGAVAAQRASMERAQARGESVEWLFFFSGHGAVQSGEAFLGLESGRLTRAVLHELIARAGASRTHVLIDACRSGLLVGGKGPGGLRLPMPAAFAAEPDWPANVGFVLSASSTRDSHEWERFGAGIFSYEVRSALRGAADADGDGAVSYGELGAFLRSANAGIASPAHRPDFLVLPPRGASGLQDPLLSWGGRNAITADVTSHAYVERQSGERLMDFHVAGFAPQLFLPADRPLFVRTADERRELLLDARNERLAEAPVSAPTLQAKGALSHAMDQLFSQPFESAGVVTYVKQWRAPDLSALEVSQRGVRIDTSRRASGWLAIAAAGVAAVGFATAWGLERTGAGLDQLARSQRNPAIEAFNGVGVGAAVLSATSAVAWLALALWAGALLQREGD